MPTPQNQAAWIRGKKELPFKVSDAPYTSPGPGQIVVKNGAVAINPYDWALAYIGSIIASHIKYPTVFGTDVAGTIVEVGPGVTRFKVGDRVAGCAVSAAKESNNAAEGGFQLYSVMRQYMVTPVPDHVTDEQASVLGLGIGTSAYGLFHTDYLGLDMPQVPPPANPQPGKKYPRAIIVTGGASSVGGCAVQLAASAGYEVVSTCSPKNFDFVKKLGAAHVFDYNSSTLVADIVRALEGRELVGAFTVGANADSVCASVMTQRLSKSPEMPTRKFIALAGGGGSDPESLKTTFGPYKMMYRMSSMMTKNIVKKYMTGIEVKFIMIVDLVKPDSCVAIIYQSFLGPALANNQFLPAPVPEVVGRGLEKVNDAIELSKKGVSAKKLVVSLP